MNTDTIDKFKIDLKAGDPDKDNEEYDLWVASSCGRSQESIIVVPNKTYKNVSLGPWVGSSCRLDCVDLCWCRIGSADVHKAPAPPSGYEYIRPGELCIMVVVRIESVR